MSIIISGKNPMNQSDMVAKGEVFSAVTVLLWISTFLRFFFLNESGYGVFQQLSLHSNDMKLKGPVSSSKILLFYLKNKVLMSPHWSSLLYLVNSLKKSRKSGSSAWAKDDINLGDWGIKREDNFGATWIQEACGKMFLDYGHSSWLVSLYQKKKVLIFFSKLLLAQKGRQIVFNF